MGHVIRLALIALSSSYFPTMALGPNHCMLHAEGRCRCRRKRKRDIFVNISSVARLKAIANTAPYVATKHAVIGLTRNVAKEFGRDRKIRCNAVAP